MSLSTTTYTAIRDQMITVLQGLTPTSQAQFPFKRAKRAEDIRSWTKTSAAFRGFQITRGSASEPTLMDPAGFMRNEQVTITLAYPLALGMFGCEDLDDVEDLIRADAKQIRDAIFSAGNYVTGQLAARPLDLPETDRGGEGIWFQDLPFDVTYYEAQSLT